MEYSKGSRRLGQKAHKAVTRVNREEVYTRESLLSWERLMDQNRFGEGYEFQMIPYKAFTAVPVDFFIVIFPYY